MAAITEDYVSFEIAKLLKEKGFDEECNKVVHQDTKNEYYFGNYTDDIKGRLLLVPTLQMAMKWLRIEHNIHIEPHIVKTKYSYGYMPSYVDLKELKQHFPFDEFDFSKADTYACMTYDKACEVAIQYCLDNLI